MTGAVARAAKTALKNIDASQIGAMLQQADLIEDWIKDLRELAFEMLENDVKVPGYKLVPKQAQRQWANEAQARGWLAAQGIQPLKAPEVISPAQAEKVLKKSKTVLPNDLVVAVSSGNTLAPESDPRPAVLNIGRQLTAALSKI